MSRQVTVTLSVAEAEALAALAECASNTWDDALGVLDSAPKVAAGYRALAKVNAALYGGRR